MYVHMHVCAILYSRARVHTQAHSCMAHIHGRIVCVYALMHTCVCTYSKIRSCIACACVRTHTSTHLLLVYWGYTYTYISMGIYLYQPRIFCSSRTSELLSHRRREDVISAVCTHTGAALRLCVYPAICMYECMYV